MTCKGTRDLGMHNYRLGIGDVRMAQVHRITMLEHQLAEVRHQCISTY